MSFALPPALPASHVALGVMGPSLLHENERSSGKWAFLSSVQRLRGKTNIADGRTFLKAKAHLLFGLCLHVSSAQNREPSIKWTKHHSIHLFCHWPSTLET